MPSPPIWTVTGLLNYFQEVHAADDRRFAFILGAGASFDSGIPMAGQLVERWLQELHTREDHERRPLATWATAANLDIDGFEYARAVEFYSQVFARRFADQPDEGYAYLERILHGRDPSFGYSVLAQVLATTRHRVVITTNFDNLIADALAIYTDKLPFVCGHESLAGFVRINPRRPLVIKVHRDLLLAPKNRVEELTALPDALIQSLRDLLRSYTPIVIGYGGNDGSLMGLLRDILQPGDIPGGIYWCYWAGGGLPGQPILDVIARHRGKLVPIQGFDELMLQLGEGLGFQRMDQRIEQRAGERARKYRESVELLQRRVYPRPAAERPDDADDADDAEMAAPQDPRAPASDFADSVIAATTAAQDLGATARELADFSITAATAPAPTAASAPAATRPVPAPPASRSAPLGPVLSARPSAEPSAITRSATPRPPAVTRSAAPEASSSATHAPAAPRPQAITDNDLDTPSAPATSSGEAPLLRQSMQALVPDEAAASDWWALKLNAERQPERALRIAAYRDALTRFPDRPELMLSLGRELALAHEHAEAQAIFRQLEARTPDDLQLNFDLAILHFAWGAPGPAATCMQRAWRVGQERGLDLASSAALAFLTGYLARLHNADDTQPLRVLRGLVPVTASPLLPLAPLLARATDKLDHRSGEFYWRLLDSLSGHSSIRTVRGYARWNDLAPLTPEAAWPHGPVPTDSP